MNAKTTPTGPSAWFYFGLFMLAAAGLPFLGAARATMTPQHYQLMMVGASIVGVLLLELFIMQLVREQGVRIPLAASVAIGFTPIIAAAAFVFTRG